MKDYLSINTRPNPLINTYDECRLYTRHYAKSFYFSSFLLPKEKRNASYAVYTFCRYADNIVDFAKSLPAGAPAQQGVVNNSIEYRIDSLLENLDDIYAGKNPELSRLSAFADAVKNFDIPKQYFSELVEGVSMDIKTKRYQTFSELDTYCYKVASVVGLIMSEILGYSDSKALTHAVHLGKAMQLTNIIRDINDDFRMDRVYIPQDELRRFGYTEDDIRNKLVNKGFTELIKHQIHRARSYYELASKGFSYLSNDGSRTTVVLMYKIYSGILDRIESRNFDIYSERLYVNPVRKIGITLKYLLNSSERKRFSAAPEIPPGKLPREFSAIDY
jgi:phytoene synthase